VTSHILSSSRRRASNFPSEDRVDADAVVGMFFASGITVSDKFYL